MTTIGVTMVKDEADIIEGTMRHIADEVDRIIVADNLSTDGTREILDRLAEELPLTVVDDPEPAYYQSAKMSALAAKIADPGDWIIPFDADELWYSRVGRIRDVLANISQGIWGVTDYSIISATLLNHYGTAVDERNPDIFRSFVWRKVQPGALPKVAFRYEPGATIEMGNHGVTLPSGTTLSTCTDQTAYASLEIRHFPYRTPQQFVRKGMNGGRVFELTDLPQEYGAHWRGYMAIGQTYGEKELEQVYRDHFWFLIPWEQGMVRDPAPYRRWEPPCHQP